jgi:general secretion pathway protein A
MYSAFFGIAELPFAITPDPRYLYLGTRHAEALAHLVYGVSEAGGFIQLTGEVGTGKTTTVRTLLARAPQGAEIALILNPLLTPLELLQSLNEELGIPCPEGAGVKLLVDALNNYLLDAHAAGRRVVLIIDEAQNLPAGTLEQVRLLTNLETESRKLLQIILIGQPELRELLARSDLRQLAQRITARYHLEPLDRADTEAYVRHRLAVAGAVHELLSPAALREVHRLSGGVPRLINVLCDRALLAAYGSDRHEVSAALVRQAAAEVFGRAVTPAWLAPLLVSLCALAVLAGAGLLWQRAQHPNQPAVVASPGAPAVATAAPGDGAAGKPLAVPVMAPTLAAQLVGADTSSDAAFGPLLRAWGARYVPGDTDACTQAHAQGYECVTLHSSLAQLRTLGRPAVLMLGDAAGRSQQLLLVGLDDAGGLLVAGERRLHATIPELAAVWFGECVLLWRPAPGYVAELKAGARGPAVRRLHRTLLTERGEPESAPASAIYTPGVQALVEEFQRAHHLQPDGVAGIETQLMLDAAVATPGSPRLGASTLPPGAATAPPPAPAPAPAGASRTQG